VHQRLADEEPPLHAPGERPGERVGLGGEAELAEQLVAALDEEWEPQQFRDQYRDDLLELIEAKAKTGLAPVKGREPRERGAEVVDMMELLKRSVGEAKGRKGEKGKKASRRRAS